MAASFMEKLSLMDETSLGDRYDETRAYVYSHKPDICLNNVRLIERSIVFIAAFFAVSLVTSYVVCRDFSMRITYVIFPLILLCGWRMIAFLKKRPDTTLEKVRLGSLIFFTVLYGVIVAIDGQLRPGGTTLIMPLAIMAFCLFLVDYFSVMVIMEAVMVIMFVLANVFIYRGDHLAHNILIVLMAMAFSLYGYWRILGSLCEYGAEEKNLRQVSSTDQLTGLLNKMSFEREARDYLIRRSDEQDAVLFIIDFDNFKHVNDQHGHLAGDEILKKFGEILKKNFRSNDIVGRVGGDEFMVMMTGSVPEEIIAKRCNTIQHELNTSKVGEASGFSCSIGVAFDGAGYRFDALYRLCDDALYEAKARGKARFVKWHSRKIDEPQSQDKVAFVATPKKDAMDRILGEIGSEYICITGESASECLNSISLYQDFLDVIYLDYHMPDITEDQLREYMHSRPIFQSIPVKDVDEF